VHAEAHTLTSPARGGAPLAAAAQHFFGGYAAGGAGEESQVRGGVVKRLTSSLWRARCSFPSAPHAQRPPSPPVALAGRPLFPAARALTAAAVATRQAGGTFFMAWEDFFAHFDRV
jgi:hypothetical protein